MSVMRICFCRFGYDELYLQSNFSPPLLSIDLRKDDRRSDAQLPVVVGTRGAERLAHAARENAGNEDVQLEFRRQRSNP